MGPVCTIEKVEPEIKIHPDCVLCGHKLTHPEWVNNAPKEVKDRLKKMYDGRRPLRLLCCDCFNETEEKDLSGQSNAITFNTTDVSALELRYSGGSFGAEYNPTFGVARE